MTTRISNAPLAGLALVAGLFAADMARAEFTLNVLHTNDFHARFEPINKYDATCSAEEDAEGQCFGGSARLVTAVRQARAKAAHSILLDAGDQFQGSLFYTYYKGRAAAEFMTLLGYQAMTVGNHEFDDGPETLRAFIDRLDFPVLMANADLSRSPELSGVVRRSTVLEVGGEKIGIIGLTPQDNAELSSPGPTITFLDPVPVVKAELAKLQASGVNKIIVLSHSGYEVDRKIAQAVPDVDVIVGGHSHTLLGNMAGAKGPYPTMIGKTAIVQAFAYSKYLGDLEVTFDDAGTVLSAKGQPILLDASVPEDGAAKVRIAELAKPLDEIRNKVVAQAHGAIDGAREICRFEECPMGDLLADAMLARVRDQGVDIALTNGGGLRASLPAGDVTMGDVLTVLPFQNTLSTFETQGAVILAALENGASQMEEGAGRFAQVAGLTYRVTPGAAVGARISDVMVSQNGAWVPLDPQARYGVVTNNYLRAGGDGYAMFQTGAENAYDYGPDLADVLAEYMTARTPVTPYTDSRITVVK
ncbi:bifunctional metallophosphatase/5'-nucleotidase [Thioclava sp. GXIMD4215]|uniref:bifunctional metallophosphatase/5'-nucleotidase n=1 Tax=Thioclava sp. GXIMD4215 TaxID=3131928 RepID=UPI003249B223